MKFCVKSASSFPTILYVFFLLFSKSIKSTVEPKITLSFFSNFVTSMTFALAIKSFNLIILPSIFAWSSFAAWYSAFSFKSPCALASAIAWIIFGLLIFLIPQVLFLFF